jgi:hypothetical protein
MDSYSTNLVEEIKKYLCTQYDCQSWEDFVDGQENGDCQLIVSYIASEFPSVKKCFGEIERDIPYIDEDDEEQILQVHHWVEISGRYFDFSKGTLKDCINFEHIYDPYVDDCDLFRYRTMARRNR